ncbi:MAG: aminotransferase class IV [Planctomycetota bacterium]|nr:aminotransferase class IV [Planctomycetota bacterium]
MSSTNTIDHSGLVAYHNGRFVPAAECRLAIYDLGIVLGAAVTDFLRTVHGQAYLAPEHARRFYESARYARIVPPVPINETLELTRRIIAHNLPHAPTGAELGVIYYMTAGENAIYAGAAAIPPTMTPTFVIHTFPLPFHFWRALFVDGAHCVTPAVRHVSPQTLSSKIKHRNRLHMWIGDREAKLADPAAIPLYLDHDGNVSETGGSNFVIYRRGQIVSPRRRNILWGVSLQVVTELASELGIPFVEEDIQPWDVINAEEAWMPTTPYSLAPVTKFNGSPIGTGKPGPVWRKMLDAWSRRVGKDLYKEVAEAKGPSAG